MSFFDFFKGPRPPELQPGEVKQPMTADEGGFIGILWGTRHIKTSNYTFFGDVKQVAIKSKTSKK